MSPDLERLAKRDPAAGVDVIAQFAPRVSAVVAARIIRAAGGRPGRAVALIHAVPTHISGHGAVRLARHWGVRYVSQNTPVHSQALNFDPWNLRTSYNQSAHSSNLWAYATGKGVGVAVIDTGIAGDMASFRTSQTDSRSRVVQTAVVNPYARTATDTYGHGTHVAGIIAGNDGARASSDPLFGKYAGAAPDASLISVKASDDDGNSTVLDVIYGLQFVVDHRSDYNIRVVNLSLESAVPQSYKTDPLDAAVEATWNKGIVVVAAAGNRGTAPDAASYAPGNDPYIISVGAVDDHGTRGGLDDEVATWSSRGTSQDGIARPDISAPGAHIVSTLAPGSAFAAMCPECIRDGEYIQAGGTSMAAPIIAGIVADILSARPTWTPNMVKGALVKTTRAIKGAREVDALAAYFASADKLVANGGLEPNSFIDPNTGDVDFARSSWSRSSWSSAPSELTAGWARSSWSCNCSLDGSGKIDPTRSSWSNATWSTAWGL